MLSNILKNFSILKKFLFINFIFFIIISIFTTLYIYIIQPSLIKDKESAIKGKPVYVRIVIKNKKIEK